MKQMLRLKLALWALIVSACAPDPTLSYLREKTPSQFSAEEARSFNAMRTLSLPNVGLIGYCEVIRERFSSYNAEDRRLVGAELRRRGLSARDVELVLRGEYGTGQTFLGLSCTLGQEPDVNKSFYRGVGHSWQAVVGGGSSFVYLEGDGTPSGMKVTGWN